MIDKNTLKDYPRPEWLPDWTDPAAYHDHGENAAAWAWEFLRRNPEYQADCAHYMSVPWCYPEGGKTPKLAGRAYNDEAEMIYFFADPPAASPSETVGEYKRRTGVEPVQLETALLHKWGLVVLNDPALDEPIWFSTDDPMPPFELQQAGFGDVFRRHIAGSIFHPHEIPGRKIVFVEWPEKDDGYMHVFAFDVRLPLDGQLAAAKMMLEEARLQGDPNDPADMIGEGDPEPVEEIKGPSNQLAKMRDYLRVYDAVWALGWDHRQEIAATIWKKGLDSRGDHSGGGSIDRAIESALKYVNGDWHRILTWAGLPRNVKKKK